MVHSMESPSVAINLSAGSSIHNSPYMGNSIQNLNRIVRINEQQVITQEEYLEDEEDGDEEDENEATPIVSFTFN